MLAETSSILRHSDGPTWVFIPHTLLFYYQPSQPTPCNSNTSTPYLSSFINASTHQSFLDAPFITIVLTWSSPSVTFCTTHSLTLNPLLTMRPFLIASIFSLLTPIISAQAVTLLASNLPSCATQCTVLINAEGSCTPPLAPVTSDQIYESCFCQSALLTSLYSSAAVQGICPSCSAADMLTIQKWYQGVCPNAGKGAPNFGTLAGATTTSSTAATPGPTTSSAKNAPSPSTASTSQQYSNSSTNPTPGPW